MEIRDKTETNLINLRRTIYLTIMSSVDFEEAGHKLLKIKLEPGQEVSTIYSWFGIWCWFQFCLSKLFLVCGFCVLSYISFYRKFFLKLISCILYLILISVLTWAFAAVPNHAFVSIALVYFYWLPILWVDYFFRLTCSIVSLMLNPQKMPLAL